MAGDVSLATDRCINDTDKSGGHDLVLVGRVAWVQGPSQAQSISGLTKREKWTPALMCLTSSDEIGLKRLTTPHAPS